MKPGKCINKVIEKEEDNFMICEVCGQAFDMRNLEEVMYHMQEEHKPKISN